MHESRILEPFRIKCVEPIHLISRSDREERLFAAKLNPFRLRAEDVFIDWLSDSGTGAMSAKQWGALMEGDESYAGSKSFYRLESFVQKLTGMDHFIPTHQGRAGERLLFSTVCKKGDLVLSNGHFDTTRANLEFNGVEALDLTLAENRQSSSIRPFKGDIDLVQVRQILQSEAERIPFGMISITNNTGGGQPVSMANLREYSALLKSFGKPLIMDICRFAANAMCIMLREIEYANTPVREICREIFSYADGCIMSAKKDGMVNIGGFIVLRSNEWVDELKSLLILTEGFPTYGGLAGRDLEAMAVGLEEGMDEDYLRYRLSCTAYFGDKLDAAGVSYVKPAGGHAIYLDARKMLPNIPVEHYPAWALCIALYVEGGIRGLEIGSVGYGKRLDDGTETYYSAELVRLAFPRRVYTQSHMDYAVEVIAEVKEKASEMRGLRITRQTRLLRHFTAEFDWV